VGVKKFQPISGPRGVKVGVRNDIELSDQLLLGGSVQCRRCRTLIFPADGELESAVRGTSFHPGLVIEPFLVGTTEVIVDRLPEVVAVVQGRSGDANYARVGAIQARRRFGIISIQYAKLVGKIAAQRGI